MLIIWVPAHQVRDMKCIWSSPFTYEKTETQKDLKELFKFSGRNHFSWLLALFCFYNVLLQSLADYNLPGKKWHPVLYVVVFRCYLKGMLENKCSFEQFWGHPPKNLLSIYSFVCVFFFSLRARTIILRYY